MKKPVRKKKVSSKRQPKKETLMDRLPKNRGEWLELVIRLTERAIKPNYQDQTMVNQKARLEAELIAWKAANRK